MPSKEGYDVLRLIEHGQTCYISSEYVEGEILAVWLRYHPHVTKKCLLSWIQSITKQLGMIHKCRKKPYYQYMNPYSIIITKEKELFFLDMEASSNESQLRIMRRRAVREAFLPPEEPYYQRGSIELDIFGLGKTIQYLLAVSEPDPPLTRREEKRFQKLLSRCLRRQSKLSYQNITEIRKHIPEYQQKKKHATYRRRMAFPIMGITLAVITLFFVVFAGHQKSQEESMSLADQEKGKESTRTQANTGAETTAEVNEAYMELALVYFLELEDYEKSLSYLENIRTDYAPADDLGMIMEIFLAEEKERDTEGLQECLESLEAHMERLEESGWEQDFDSYYRCLIQGYGILDTQEASEQILRLGRIYLDRQEEEGRTKETAEEAVKAVMEYMAAAYEKMGKTEEAAAMYGRILELEADPGKREELYRHMVNLYELCEEKEKALDTCIRGIKELEDSWELRVLHIRLLCRDSSIGREACAQAIQEYIRQMPEILEKEEFQKLQREYEIQVEGEEVWVGK